LARPAASCVTLTSPSSLLRVPPHRHPHSFPTRRSSDLPDRGHDHRDDQNPPEAHPAAHVPTIPMHAYSWASSRARSCCIMSPPADRKSTRLNSSHVKSSYAVCCSKKKNPDTAC